MPSLTQIIYAEAATLPLKDAAFQFWRYKSNFDSEELPPIDWNTPEAQQRFKESFAESYRREREFAHEGPTFDRMKRVHPHATDADIREAIKAAVKLDDDCNRYFDRNYTDFFKAIDAAVAKAKRDNPGFLDTTYRAAGSYLLFLWK